MTVRLGLGILGVLMMLAGAYGVVATAMDRAWAPMISAASGILIGFLLAYSAFVEMPWERHARLHKADDQDQT